MHGTVERIANVGRCMSPDGRAPTLADLPEMFGKFDEIAVSAKVSGNTMFSNGRLDRRS
jgi:hypothetical protein